MNFNSDLPWRVEIPTLRKTAYVGVGTVEEPACAYCKHYSTETICDPEGWCDLFPCEQVNTSWEMVCDLYEKRERMEH